MSNQRDSGLCRPRGGARVGLGLAALAVLWWGCAKQVFPPGGPEDRTPPRVVETSPPAHSVGVHTDARVWIAFSEGMDRQTVERSVFVAPDPGDEVGFGWWRNRVTLELPGGLAPGRTYVVTVGTDALDERRNRLAASYSFAFSTGPTLDQGAITGWVGGPKRAQGPAAGRPAPPGGSAGTATYIWAYDLHKSGADPLRDHPGYTTQTDDAGRYTLRFLSPGRYRVFAIRDVDQDRKYTPQKDALAVPTKDVDLSSAADSVELTELIPVQRDTTRPRLLSARAPDRSHVALRFSEPVRVFREHVTITGSLAVVEVYQAADDSALVHCLTQEQTPETPYTVALQQTVDLSGNTLAPDGGTATFVGSSAPDTVKPHVVQTDPTPGAQHVPLGQRITIRFDEAMRPNELHSTFWSVRDSTGVPPGVFLWEGPTALCFSPDNPWPPGRTYRLLGDAGPLQDYSGNSLADSIEVRFTALREEEMGTFSGVVRDQRPGAIGVFHLLADRIGAGASGRAPAGPGYHWTVPDTGSYTSGYMLAGDYGIRAFRDEDGSGTWSAGAPFPFVPAERWASFSDTVTVRARWETADINITFGE